MKRLLLQSLHDIYRSHSSEWPLLVEHWPKRAIIMFRSLEDVEAHEDADRECWRYRGSF